SGDINSGDINSGDIKESPTQYHGSTDLQRQRILEFLQTKETSTNAEICTLLDIKSSRARVLLSQMVEDGLLIAEGEKKGRVYRIKNT
ncbi:MAG: winged helix-turn-helix domain-containing protein, partial [Sphaerochaeta sp.]